MNPLAHQIAAANVVGPQDASALWKGVSSALTFASPGKSLGESVEAVCQENWRLQEDIDNLEAKLGSPKEACGIVELASRRHGTHGTGNNGAATHPDWHQLAEKDDLGGSGNRSDGNSSFAHRRSTPGRAAKHDAFMAGHRAAGQLPPRKWREQVQHQEDEDSFGHDNFTDSHV